MKLILFSVLTMFSLSSFSQDKVILSCITPGDALGALHLVQGKINRIDIVNDMEEEVKVDSYEVNGSFKNIVKGDADTLVGAKDFERAYGGAVRDAILLRVFPGQKEARLAMNDSVYFLTCTK